MPSNSRLLLAVSATAVLVGLGSWLDGPRAQTAKSQTHLVVPALAFASTRHEPSGDPFTTAEIYYLTADGTTVRVTENTVGDGFPALAPGGKRIAFDSNRLRGAGEPLNVSDLFVMNPQGDDQLHLVRGSSASWSPDGKHLAYHASATGTALPIRPDPGAPTTDSDIFVLNVDDLLSAGTPPTNITNDPLAVDDDPDWSPLGTVIAFTSHLRNSPATAEIYTISAGSQRVRLTFNDREERAPDWSPDGTRIVHMCRRDPPAPQAFEICVMNADGTDQHPLTVNGAPDLSPVWAPGGQQIVFHRAVSGRFQLFIMNADGTGETQLTDTAGINGFANAGEVRIRVAQ